MSDEPVNLNRYRKQKARAEKRARADRNAAKFGRSKTERAADDAQKRKGQRHLDGHALQKPQSRDKDTQETP